MKITKDLIFDGRSIFGGWSRAQIEALGLEWPLRNGWIRRAEGKEITEEMAREFMRLTNSHIDPIDMANHRNREHLRSI